MTPAARRAEIRLRRELPGQELCDYAIVKDALLVPKTRGIHTSAGTRAAGVFDAQNAPVTGAELETFRWRGEPTEALAVRTRSYAVKLAGRWLFGGLCRPHFGHVVTNSMGRLGALEHINDLNGVVFVGEKTRAEKDPHFPGIASAFNLPELHHVCPRPTIVDELVIAPDLFSEGMQCQPDPAFVDWVRRKRPAAEELGSKLFITRRSIGPEFGRVLCEDVLEANLVAAGFETFAPEAFTIQQQLSRYRGAAEIVCVEGSALHLIALAVEPTTRVTVICRRPSMPDILQNHLNGFFGDNLLRIDAICQMWWREARAENRGMAELDFDKLRGELVEAGVINPETTWQNPTGEDVKKSLAAGASAGARFLTTDEHRAYVSAKRELRAEKQKMADGTLPTGLPEIGGIRYVRMLGRLHAALNPNWYLEVGTFTGRSLSKVDCNFVAVDPKFRFKAPLSHPGAAQMHLFQQTSDDFFASGFAARNEIRFDFAFLDGLHHYEVLLRDFMNAEKQMAKGGVIALHDCCPSTVEMTAREQVRGAWTGDVWKTLLILLRNRPDLDIQVAAAAPTGLVIIRNLDPESTVLGDQYDALIADYDPIGIDDLNGGIAGYYGNFELRAPEEVISIFA